MEKIFVHLEKLSITFIGVNFFKNTPKTKIQVFKSVFFVVSLIIFISLGIYDVCFDSNMKFKAKLMVLCTAPGCSSYLILFISFWCNEGKYQNFVNWVQARYAPRSFTLMDDISKIEYRTLSTQIWKTVK